jgi:hypothetical protein
LLCLVQACQEVPEFALLVLQALERLGAVFIEGAVGTVVAPPIATVYPLIPATYSSAPDDECKDHEADRPPHHEAEDHQKDPGWSP